jgi:hypothetical protein
MLEPDLAVAEQAGRVAVDTGGVFVVVEQHTEVVVHVAAETELDAFLGDSRGGHQGSTGHQGRRAIE